MNDSTKKIFRKLENNVSKLIKNESHLGFNQRYSYIFKYISTEIFSITSNTKQQKMLKSSNTREEPSKHNFLSMKYAFIKI